MRESLRSWWLPACAALPALAAAIVPRPWLAEPLPDPGVWEVDPPGEDEALVLPPTAPRPVVRAGGILLPEGWGIRTREPIADVAVDVEPAEGTVVWIEGPGGAVAVGDGNSNAATVAVGSTRGTVRVTWSADGRICAGELCRPATAAPPTPLLVVARGGEASVRHLDGDVRDGGAIPARHRLAAAASAGAWGAATGAFAWVLGNAGFAVASLLVATLPTCSWGWVVDRLHLARVDPTDVRWSALITLIAAAGCVALSRTLHSVRPGGSTLQSVHLGALCGSVAVAAVADGGLGAVVWAALLLAVSGPARPADGAWVKGDLCAALAASAALVAGGNWLPEAVGPASVLAWAAWRGIGLFGHGRAIAQAGPRLLLVSMAFLVASEATVRATPQGSVWLRGHLEPAQVLVDPSDVLRRLGDRYRVHVSGCGGRRPILFLGGSATGGAVQYAALPDMFFAARLAAFACSAGREISVVNAGEGGADTVLLALRSKVVVPRFQPSVVVMYIGNNDTIGQTSGPQGWARVDLLRPPTGVRRALLSLTSDLRLYQGLRLALRGAPAGPLPGTRRPVVPLDDAARAIRLVHAELARMDGRLLLLSEHMADERPETVAYSKMLVHVASELQGAAYRDAHAFLSHYPQETVLLDRVHLAARGNDVLAQQILVWLDELGWLPAAGAAPVQYGSDWVEVEAPEQPSPSTSGSVGG